MPADTLSVATQIAFPGFDLELAEEIKLEGITAVFGPSGSGKSTLLRIIAGFETRATGRIVMGDRVWVDSVQGSYVAAHRRPVGYMFQDGRLFEHMNVDGNLRYAAKRGPPRDGGFDMSDVVATFNLESLLTRRVNTLSGGEKQRVALARTLLSRPQLLLLDEPLAALDQDRKAEILPYLEDVPKRFGVPTIYVSHAVDEVARLADTVVVLAAGRVKAVGDTVSILERLDLQPLTGRFEAGAVVDAVVVGHDRRLHLTMLQVDGQSLTMPMVAHAVPGDTLRVRIRARDVAIAVTRPERTSIRNILSGTLAEIVPETETAYAEAFIELGGVRIRSRLTRAAVEDLDLRVGMPVFALIRSVSFDR